ncbi:glycosyltransferase family 4 protein [Mucilaginibacter robiniae]|uniref:Glycosyltransferase family 4 protein n=2 Tax=Mucilaginibacter robiniae TaxID=2728022 RepID=A0A7L5E5Z9_9SPHI|nr:glycosyltransferase family 4 protein [Mucilaginibacter robiniae]
MIDASGIGVYLKNILGGLIGTCQITLLGDPAKLTQFQRQVSIIPFYEPIYSIKEQLGLRKLIPSCDLFWSPHYNVPLLPIKGKKRVVTIHDVYHLAFSSQLSLPQRVYAKLVISAAVKLSKRIITVSNFSKNELIKYTAVPATKINVVHNGVNSDAKIGNINELQFKYKLPKQYLLYVGNVKPHKNLRKLLEAYLLLDKALQEQYKVVIVGKKDGFITGDTALFNWIEEQPGLANKIIFTGFVADEDMNSLYHYASVFVFPSIYEGFGLPSLEAMVNNCPVAVSNASCLPEVCGNAAVYFDPLNAQNIADSITRILTDDQLKNELVAAGKKHVAEFTWQQAIKQHISIFNELLS